MKKRIFAAILAAVMCLASFNSYAAWFDSIGNTHSSSSRSSGGGGSAGGGTVKFVPKNGVVDGLAGPGTASGTTNYADTTGRQTIDGTWSKTADGNWQFAVNGKTVHSGWYLIKNTKLNQNQWYYFEADKMVVGWKWILCADGLYRCYFFNGDNGDYRGACALNSTTPDKYVVNASGAWTVEGVEVTKKSL